MGGISRFPLYLFSTQNQPHEKDATAIEAAPAHNHTRPMKAIINVNKNSAYAKYNGLTFTVNSIMNGLFNLEFPPVTDALGKPMIPGFTADFGHKEIFIVDIENEMQVAREMSDWYGGQKTYTFNRLQDYCDTHKIKICTHFVPAN